MSAPPRWLFWHRRDLRLADNRGLVAALAATPAVTGVVLLDPREWQAPDQAPARLWFWRESLVELQERWRQAGSRLLLLQGDAETWLPPLARAVANRAWMGFCRKMLKMIWSEAQPGWVQHQRASSIASTLAP